MKLNKPAFVFLILINQGGGIGGCYRGMRGVKQSSLFGGGRVFMRAMQVTATRSGQHHWASSGMQASRYRWATCRLCVL